MAAYLPGSQAETIQTLHLMNPSYSACADVAPAPSDGNSSQHQHSFTGYSVPPLLLHTQQPALQAMYTPQQSPSGQFSSRISPYTWTNSTTTNEVPFVSSSEATPLNHVFASKYASLTPESQFSQYYMGRQAVNEGATLGPNVTHALSLSLSPGHHSTQMPYYDSMQSDALAAIPDLTYVVGDKSGFKGDRLPDMDYATHYRPSSADGALGTTFHNYMNDMSRRHAHMHAQPEVSSTGGFFTGSKYLKAVQHLLDEVVSVEDAIKKSSSSTKHAKTQSWSAHNVLGDASGLMRGMAETVAGKEGMAWGLSIAKSASCPDVATMELTPQARQELQMKKAKLMAMLEEVDRRYKQYHSQMQAIVSLFESAAGEGTATCYTALALQTISRHFRCLRDAIAGQVRVAGKGLCEEEHLSQHRALQQLHMMHQHAWRPQRGLPERAVSVLRAWLFEHFLHPYPKDADKVLLAKQTGLTRNQVSNWFINARVRLWKPMVEEMYQEESKETNVPINQRLNDIEEEQDELRIGSAAQRDTYRGIDPNLLGNLNTDHGRDEDDEKEIRLHRHATRSIVQNPLAEVTRLVDSHLSTHELQGAKKARNSMESFAARAEVYPDMQGDEEKQTFAAMRGLETQSYGPYLPNVGATRGNAASILGGNSVSLTLGLQRSDPLEAQHQQQQQQHLFFHHLQEPGYAHGHNTRQLPDGFLERGSVDPGTTSQNYYSSMAATNLGSNSFEILSQLQNQKQLPGHVLHPDFTS